MLKVVYINLHHHKTRNTFCGMWVCLIDKILRNTASLCKISLKSDSQLLSYGQKTIFNMVVRHL